MKVHTKRNLTVPCGVVETVYPLRPSGGSGGPRYIGLLNSAPSTVHGAAGEREMTAEVVFGTG